MRTGEFNSGPKYKVHWGGEESTLIKALKGVGGMRKNQGGAPRDQPDGEREENEAWAGTLRLGQKRGWGQCAPPPPRLPLPLQATFFGVCSRLVR